MVCYQRHLRSIIAPNDRYCVNRGPHHATVPTVAHCLAQYVRVLNRLDAASDLGDGQFFNIEAEDLILDSMHLEG